MKVGFGSELQRFLESGKSNFTDRATGYNYNMLEYKVGPPPAGGGAGGGAGAASPPPPDADKMKRDIVLGIKSLPTLPTKTRDVLALMNDAGWARAGATDADWVDVLRTLFDEGLLQMNFTEQGYPFEIWL